MRQLLISVPRGSGDRVLELAGGRDGVNMVRLDADGPDGPLDLVIVHVPNDQVEGMFKEMEGLDQAHTTLVPRPVFAMHPPETAVADQVREVHTLAPLEVYLSGLSSIGSWRGFLGYAAAAAVVVWIGLYTNTVYLLTAAMLLAPFAGPAMTLAIGSARGDLELIGRSLVRYFVALALAVGVAWALSMVFGLSIPTQQMAAAAQISTVTALLPLIAGAAGAIHLFQSERSSLVSGAAVGLLVAASLAPPTGMIGMALALGRWEMATHGLFVLLLQLVGINLTAGLLFRLLGLAPEGPRYDRGRGWVAWTSFGITAAALAALLAWQFQPGYALKRDTLERRAAAEIQTVVEGFGGVDAVEMSVRFTRTDAPGGERLLAELYVERHAGNAEADQAIQRRLTREVQARLADLPERVVPLVSVTVLAAPPR